jgi:branched-subunit amino acid transport protein
MTIWLTILAAGLLTFLTRLSFIFLFGRREMPSGVGRALRFVPPAVLSAIISPQLLLPAGTLELSLGNERLLAGLAAALVAWRTRNVVATIAVGILALVVLQQVGAAGR